MMRNTPTIARRAIAARALDFFPRYYTNTSTLQSSRYLGATRALRTLCNTGSNNNTSGITIRQQQQQQPRRRFNFASSQYASCFTEIPTPDVDKLRKDAVDYLDNFDKQTWYDDPVRIGIICCVLCILLCCYFVLHLTNSSSIFLVHII